MALYRRVCDSRVRYPILGDPYAAALVNQIDYDFTTLRRPRGNTALIASRARQLDTWAQRFLDAHPDGLAGSTTTERRSRCVP
jgi:O-methyltransferase involved in polyketide biosynthesis